MSIIDAIMGKNMAIEELSKSGGVGYTEPAKVIVSADTIVQEGIGIVMEENTAIKLEAGKSYTVTTDSGSYTSKCVELRDGIFVIGNAAAFGGADTGENYVVALIFDEGELDNIWIFYAADNNGGSHITVSEAETVHTIDQKYLGGICLPVVELTTIPTVDGAIMSAEEAAQLDKVAEAQSPIVICVTSEDGPVKLFSNFALLGETAAFFSHNAIANQLWTFVGSKGTWFARIG